MKRTGTLLIVSMAALEGMSVAQPIPRDIPAPLCSHTIPAGSSVDQFGVVRDQQGSIIAQYGRCTGATSAPQSSADVVIYPASRPSEYAIDYLEGRASMFSGVTSQFKVPSVGPNEAVVSSANNTASWRWSVMLASFLPSADYADALQAGISYGPWPEAEETLFPATTNSNMYWAWSSYSQIDQQVMYHTAPVPLHAGDQISVSIRLVALNNLGLAETTQQGLYDPNVSFTWSLDIQVNGTPLAPFRVSTGSLGTRTFDYAFPALMQLSNVPGFQVFGNGCKDALPSNGYIIFGPSTVYLTNAGDVSHPIIDQRYWPGYGTLVGSNPDLHCSPWYNVTVNQPYVVLMWPPLPATTPVIPNPVPAVGKASFSALLLVLLVLGLLGAKRFRKSD
jgi:hypothetical protein